MGVTRYDITEEAFRKQSLPHTELSILTGMDSSSYLITDPQSSVIAVRSFTHSPNERWWTLDDRLSNNAFAKVRLAWQSRRFTLVPARLYNGENRAAFLEGLTQLDSTETVLADAVPELDAFLVYAIDQHRLANWRRAFVGCRFYHAMTPMLHQLAVKAQRLGRPAVFAYLQGGNIYTLGLDRNQLRFCNGFASPEAKDSLYYVLLAYQQCGWDPQQVPLYVCGEILPDADLSRLLYRYIKQLHFIDQAGALQWGPAAAQHPIHLFYDLAALQQFH